MAKLALINKQHKREKLVAQYAKKRETIKALELTDRTYLEVTGLSDVHLAHIQQIINDISSKTK